MPPSWTPLGPAPPQGRCVPALRRRLPVLAWLPHYSLRWLKLDLIAGLSVGLTVIPQGLAYAEVAGLPPQYGLYSAFMGCFVYFFLGTARDVTLGPTALMSLLVSTYTPRQPAFAVLLAFLSGCVQLAMGCLRLGFLLDFVSCPVIKGFTSAAAVTIGFGQVKGGGRNPGPGVRGAAAAPEADAWTSGPRGPPLVLRSAPQPRAGVDSRHSPQCPRGLGSRPGRVRLRGDGTAAFRALRGDGPGAPSAPAAALLRVHCERDGFLHRNGAASQGEYRIYADQELLAIGLTNVLGSLVSAYPVTGSFGRTAVNAQSGVCTPAGGLVTGALVLLSLNYLTSLFRYIPKSALAAVIIVAVAPLFDTKIPGRLWRVKRLDLLPFGATFLLCFWEVQYGILAGVLVSLLVLLHSVARPALQVSEGPLLVVRPASGLHFPAVEALREAVLSCALRGPGPPRAPGCRPAGPAVLLQPGGGREMPEPRPGARGLPPGRGQPTRAPGLTTGRPPVPRHLPTLMLGAASHRAGAWRSLQGCRGGDSQSPRGARLPLCAREGQGLPQVRQETPRTV
ncbi:sodium-independent sulfate anion transporter isoform X3 [Sorex araneus]|uniref:sodium-independent sulfate anion transporter isoform X3 n=1 Tax=Sorex araneus TaxID=42254 RepID=UPI0024334D8C|nr:sodium-independent sulfate anion transporter isoform X3 [Sorex araneus]